MSTIKYKPNPNILNPALYNTSNIELQFYQNRLQWPWRRGDWHALGWVFMALGIVVIYSLLNLHDIRLDSQRLKIAIHNRRNRGEARLEFAPRSTYDRISTHLRAFAYMRYQRIASISVGMCTLILVGFAFPFLYIFTQHPYYAREPFLGPPPISGRSGMMALAMLPFILALGMKVNLVSLVTGVGHEKLNVLHRWLGMLMGILSVIHAVPFVVEPVKNGGWALCKEKFMSHPTYWNGVGAFVCLFWLCIASQPFIRRWCYEVFVHLHIMAGVGFLGLMFWHCNNMLTSWHYLYASFAIWVGCLSYRLVFRTNFIRHISGEQAHVKLLTEDGVQITIPTTLRWSAGQHVFVRIPSISPFDNHPFTVASFPDKPIGEHNDLVVVFKPHAGFTRKVYNLAKNNPDTSVRAYLDGPYGGLSRKLESFETVLLIAGGSGITPIIGHLAELAKKIRRKEAVTRDVRIIWTVKRFESLEWFKDAISQIARTMPRNSLLVQYFVTQETPVALPAFPISATREWPSSPGQKTPMTPVFPKAAALPTTGRAIPDEHQYELSVLAMQKELNHPAAGTASTSNSPIYSTDVDCAGNPFEPEHEPPKKLPPLGDEVLLEFGRPPLRETLRIWAEGFGRRACIYVCGPPGMKVDVANAVADMQSDIWMGGGGELGAGGVEREEVYLHTESFGW
ncbi:ferric reductase NAD binding domain-containing protein [Geopyxis carbonaria]|nr:ferric reductase NAD binding domain-containing protein [Geopyxis carbonaria]